MNPEDLVLVETMDEGIAILTLNRPDKRNALNIALMEQFCQLLQNLSDYRVIIIKGNGPCFCSGMDLKEAEDGDLLPEVASHIAHMLTAIYKSHAVTIAAVHGYAVAGGAGVMTACDFVVATQSAQIGFPEVRRGLVAAKVITVLKRQMRQREMRELLLRGYLVSAETAKGMGLVNTVVGEDVLFEAMKIAKDVLKGGPKAISQTKMLIDKLAGCSFESDLQTARDFHQEFLLQDEAKEGVQAWRENRDPNWVI